jgi:hypothetical protein
VALVMLAAQVGLSKLLHRSKAQESTSTLATREPDTAESEALLAQSLEEVIIQELGETTGAGSPLGERSAHSSLRSQPKSTAKRTHVPLLAKITSLVAPWQRALSEPDLVIFHRRLKRASSQRGRPAEMCYWGHSPQWVPSRAAFYLQMKG